MKKNAAPKKPAKPKGQAARSSARKQSARTTKGTSRKPRKAAQPTRGERVIAWIEKYCRVPEGKDVGKPMRLRDWQKRDIIKIYDNPHRTRRAIISFGKKNGKTSLAACLLLAHLCGPEARPNSQLVSSAMSRDQAAIVFNLAAKIVRMSPDLDAVITIRDSQKQLYCPELGTLYKALSAEAPTTHGISPIFALHDELGQVRGPRSELFDAIETAMSAHADPLSIIISTQAATDADLLSTLIDDALAAHDPKTVISLYTADPNIDPFSEEAIRQANPAFGDFQNAEEVLNQANEARRMPSREASYRNLILNQRVQLNQPFISRSVWQACSREVVEDLVGLPVYGGLDLSETTDLTALVLEAPFEGEYHVKPTFWMPHDGLLERARRDRAPYDQWVREGFIEAVPGRTVGYDYVAEYLYDLFASDLDIRCIAFDRWNFRHLKPWLLQAGFPDKVIEQKFVEFGQGFASMSPALRELETALLEEKIRHGGHPVLTMCAANAVVQRDPAGNRKLTKAKSHGRIDGLIALTMAHAMAATHREHRQEYVSGSLMVLA